MDNEYLKKTENKINSFIEISNTVTFWLGVLENFPHSPQEWGEGEIRGGVSYYSQVIENVIHFRNATLELLSDTRDRNFRSAQSNNRHSEFDNLALSVERDGQAMSEVSSFHTASLCSQHEGLQVSVASQVPAEVVSFVI